MALYSYTLADDTCPQCKADLNQSAALTVEGTPCHLDDGAVVESGAENAHYIGEDTPVNLAATCTKCGADLTDDMEAEPESP